MGLGLEVAGGRKQNVEPFYGTLTLYDLRSEQKLSETIHFDCNDPHPSFPVPADADPVTLSREAVFTVDYPHDAVYLVVTFEKTLQADIATVADAYRQGAEKEKVGFPPLPTPCPAPLHRMRERPRGRSAFVPATLERIVS